MGLLLSVLVACVGVIELISFYYNVKRNLTFPTVRSDLSHISDGYLKELRNAQAKAEEELPGTSRDYPTFRLNSHEDIEIEYDESLARSRSPSPRTFLVTEKEERTDRQSPRRFVVSEDTNPLKKSKSQTSIPEFLIQEEKNSPKSPHKPRYVLKEQLDTSCGPIPLPRQFLVTEDELSTVAFEDSTGEYKRDVFRHSESSYPSVDLPQVPRNSISNELEDNPIIRIKEFDVDEYRSTSPASGKIDVILETTNFNTTQYWTNKILVEPSFKSRSRFPKEFRKVCLATPTVQRIRSKSESECQKAGVQQKNVNSFSNLDLEQKVSGEDAFQKHTTYDEEYLNSLDGVSKAKYTKKKTIARRKNIGGDSFEKPTSSLSDPTTKTLTDAVAELEKVSDDSGESIKKDEPPEPFWVTN